jgi:hypothetical protein
MTTQGRIFLSVRIISFTGAFLTTGLTIMAPIIAMSFHLPPEKLSWMLSAILIPSAAFLLPLSKVADLYGRRRMYTRSLLAYSLITLSLTLTPNFFYLLTGCLLQGISLAGILVSYMPLLLAATPRNRQGKYLGACVAMTYLGLTLGPPVGGVLAGTLGWRCLFLCTGILACLAYGIILPVKQEWYAPTAPFVNIVSTLLLIAGILCFLFGLSAYLSYPYLCWLGLFLLCLFLLHEYRSRHPLLPLFLFKSLSFSAANLTACMQYSATYGITFLLSLYLQLVHNFSPLLSAVILLIQPILMTVLSPLAGSGADRYGCRRMVTVGLFLSSLGLWGFACFPHCTVEMLLLFLLFTGTGAALFGAPNNSAIMSAVAPSYHGLASGTLALSRTFGQALSMAAVTYILARFSSASVLRNTELLSAMHIAYLLFAVLSVIAVIVSLIPAPATDRR